MCLELTHFDNWKKLDILDNSFRQKMNRKTCKIRSIFVCVHFFAVMFVKFEKFYDSQKGANKFERR